MLMGLVARQRVFHVEHDSDRVTTVIRILEDACAFEHDEDTKRHIREHITILRGIAKAR